MILRGRIRGNARQLADYLLRKGDNDFVQVFDIRGTTRPDDLKQSLIEMGLTAELSGRTDKAIYGVVFNPRRGEDQRMTPSDWHRAAEIMEEEAKFTGQPRVMVLHQINGRLHLHVEWSRFDLETGKMIPNRYSRYAQDRARKRIERELEHLRTPEKNADRPEMRQLLAALWQQHTTGKEFVQALADHGYTVAQTPARRPYVVINSRGVAFDLDRELRGIRIREIKARLKGIDLPDKKHTIAALNERRTVERVPMPMSARDRKIEELKKQLQPSRDNDRSGGR